MPLKAAIVACVSYTKVFPTPECNAYDGSSSLEAPSHPTPRPSCLLADSHLRFAALFVHFRGRAKRGCSLGGMA
jgi:hypothetical protein